MIRVAVYGVTEVFFGAEDDTFWRTVRAWHAALPPMDADEIAEVERVYGGTRLRLPGDTSRPFRAPHYTTSPAGIFGRAYPGEISLATCGVLVLSAPPLLPISILRPLPRVLRAGISQRHPAAPVALVFAFETGRSGSR